METKPDAPASEQQKQLSTLFFRQATDVAHVCREIVLATSVEIDNRKYVRVEGWTAIAVAHGCIATIKEVEQVATGIRAVAEIHRMSDGAILTAAEGYVGQDEPDWYGGPVNRWDKIKKCYADKVLKKRADFAIRAMAQTRATSRACRTAFSHVIVLMNAGLETVPFEEIKTEQDDAPENEPTTQQPPAAAATPPAAAAGTQEEKKTPTVPRDPEVGLRDKFRDHKWEAVKIHFGKDKDKALGELEPKKLRWWITDWHPKPFGNRPIPAVDLELRAALDVADEENSLN